MDNIGTLLDVVCLDKIYDSDARAWKLKSDSASAPSDDVYAAHAFIVIRNFAKDSDKYSPTISTTIQINSPFLRDVGKEVVGQVQDVNWNATYLVVDLQILLGFFPRLCDHRASLTQGESTYTHLDFLITYLNTHHSQVLKEIRSLVDQQEISWDLLWAILLPGSILYMRCHVSSEPRCVRLKKAYIETSSEWGSRWRLDCEFVDADRSTRDTRYGMAIISPLLWPFNGAKKIYDLHIYPIEWYNGGPIDALKERLIQRGRIWEDVGGILHRHYSGAAFRYEDERFVGLSVDSRIMVDGNLNDELRLLTTPLVYGFSLSDKLWLAFNVSNIREVQWDDEADANLILPQGQRELINSLVATHTSPEPLVGDFVEGKGLGLVFNLHGRAGVGKTLTVEATSARLRRPLYVIGAGDLGTNASELDQRLTDVFKISHSWQALVVIDEADVFLEKRSLHDIQRNAMVAVFLRHLEYFRGILFLTTNRVEMFDEAFQSRIHVSVRYQDLTPEAKCQIWRAFLLKADGEGAEWLTDDRLGELSERKLNGRQIKNVVKVAHSLAMGECGRIGYAHVTQALNMMDEFESSSHSGLNLVSISLILLQGLWGACAIMLLAIVTVALISLYHAR